MDCLFLILHWVKVTSSPIKFCVFNKGKEFLEAIVDSFLYHFIWSLSLSLSLSNIALWSSLVVPLISCLVFDLLSLCVCAIPVPWLCVSICSPLSSRNNERKFLHSEKKSKKQRIWIDPNRWVELIKQSESFWLWLNSAHGRYFNSNQTSEGQPKQDVVGLIGHHHH